MLKIENLSFRYGRRSAPVLKGVDMELGDGEVGILLGQNGSGKTTLFKNLTGIHKPDSGVILLDGRDILGMSCRERAGRIAYVPQEIRFGGLSVYDSVLTGRISYFGMRAGAEDRRAVERVLSDLRLEHCAYRNVETLSGGERQKTAMARALVQEPKLLILDEPTGNLDMANELLTMEEAGKLAKSRNISILCSLHDLNQALWFGDRFFFLKDGKVKYSGKEEIINEKVINDIFGIEARILQAEGRKIILHGRTSGTAQGA